MGTNLSCARYKVAATTDCEETITISVAAIVQQAATQAGIWVCRPPGFDISRFR